MNVAAKFGGLDLQVEVVVEEFNVTVNAMIRRLVAPVDQRIMAVNHLHFALVLRERDQVGVVGPKRRAGGVRVGDELIGVAPMQVTDRRRQHDDIPGGERTFKNELPHDRRVRTG